MESIIIKFIVFGFVLYRHHYHSVMLGMYEKEYNIINQNINDGFVIEDKKSRPISDEDLKSDMFKEMMLNYEIDIRIQRALSNICAVICFAILFLIAMGGRF